MVEMRMLRSPCPAAGTGFLPHDDTIWQRGANFLDGTFAPEGPTVSHRLIRFSALPIPDAVAALSLSFTCPDARLVSYRRSTAEPEIADQWYVASQLWADAVLLVAIENVQPS